MLDEVAEKSLFTRIFLPALSHSILHLHGCNNSLDQRTYCFSTIFSLSDASKLHFGSPQ
jgi:hypothetical protein